MPTRKWLRTDHTAALREGAVWRRIKGKHEPDIQILRVISSRIGVRYLVQGLESERQWFVGSSTLLDAYRPELGDASNRP